MADDSVKTVRATFKTREAADRAVEHLVQQHGIARNNVFVQATDTQNTAGTKPSGADAAQGNGSRSDAPLHGEIEVSADVTDEEVAKAERAFHETGARNVVVR
ncbi:hypothetical protein ACUSIJ_10920 [Pseudochelatococcus sp. B33]